MLTPRFQLRQTENHLTIEVHAPYVDLKSAEYFAKEFDFRFVATPYFLRLQLPGSVVETEEGSVNYDIEKGDFIINLQKATPGEVFHGLDLLSVLLAQRPQQHLEPKVSLIGDQSEVLEDEEEGDSGDEWFLDQKLHDDQPVEIGDSLYGYGFGSKQTGLFQSHEAELLEVVDIADADNKSQDVRRREREKRELEDFSEDHYLADFMVPPSLVLDALEMAPPFNDVTELALTTAEQESLLQLPRKSYLVDKDQKKILLLTAVSLVYSWAYDRRVTEGEHCVESGWAIAKVTPAIAYFEEFRDLRSILVACVRRSITYPLLRHWDLSLISVKDTADIFKLGQVAVLKCLLKVRHLFLESEPRYILNQLYLNDLCTWIQFCKEEKIKALGCAVEKCVIDKSDMNLDLEELESAARLVAEEEEFADVADRLTNMKMGPAVPDSDDEDSSTSSFTSDSEDSNSESDGEKVEGKS